MKRPYLFDDPFDLRLPDAQMPAASHVYARCAVLQQREKMRANSAKMARDKTAKACVKYACSKMF